MKRYPLLARWLRIDQFLYQLVVYCEHTAARARRGLLRWLWEADRPIPRCLARKPLQPAIEGLETRFMPAVGFLFHSSTYSANENDGFATIGVDLTGVGPGSYTVDYATSNGTA